MRMYVKLMSRECMIKLLNNPTVTIPVPIVVTSHSDLLVCFLPVLSGKLFHYTSDLLLMLRPGKLFLKSGSLLDRSPTRGCEVQYRLTDVRSFAYRSSVSFSIVSTDEMKQSLGWFQSKRSF